VPELSRRGCDSTLHVRTIANLRDARKPSAG
jgi:hypothetical protein